MNILNVTHDINNQPHNNDGKNQYDQYHNTCFYMQIC